MSNLVLFLLMMCGGVFIAVQPSINARLAQKTGVIESSTVSFAVGALALLIVSTMVGKGSLRGVAAANWWELTGGLCGAFYVTLIIFAVPRIGTAAAMAATIAAQLATGLLLDHYRLFGYQGAPFDLKRGIGVVLLLIGAALVFRR